MSVVVEVEELVTPLSYDPYGIFDECAHNQKAPYCGNISARKIFRSACQSSAIFNTHNSSQPPPLEI